MVPIFEIVSNIRNLRTPSMLLSEPIDQYQIDHLRKKGLIHPDETILSSGKAGEGNMNVTLAVRTDKRTLILKQSRPFVAKYPQVPAPPERTGIEFRYYQCLASNQKLANYAPIVLGFDRDHWILAMEFIEQGTDFLGLYKNSTLFTEELAEELLHYLKELHGLPKPDFPDNMAMRILNHQHIFELPFKEENGFDLDGVQPGLQELSQIVKTDRTLIDKIGSLGERYLSPGKHLIHGDFYPGSWLSSPKGLKVIDTEFAYLGDPEFDLGVMLAHLKMARVPKNGINHIVQQYPLEKSLLAAFTGVEILRRLFGLAQLPLDLSLVEKEKLAKHAIQLIFHEQF
ncbi:phosphotransferase [Cyclobacterium jeungdonense]|uniref:Phosphotransferase n=1 Tax=Cyclobacterium jeungdonense TaxID=708087 RepID=A0ABT8CD58_9BACT|nr:phosphotransferase [Cyclobacterium jeungdonense]MDN3689894.1 phosphotransferase [Cyclobacterium jeungdonense]